MLFSFVSLILRAPFHNIEISWCLPRGGKRGRKCKHFICFPNKKGAEFTESLTSCQEHFSGSCRYFLQRGLEDVRAKGTGRMNCDGLWDLHGGGTRSGERVLALHSAELELSAIEARWPLAIRPSQARKREMPRLGAIDPLLAVEDDMPVGCDDAKAKPVLGLHTKHIDPQDQRCRISRHLLTSRLASADCIDL